jgi:hypothetical protein
MNLHGMARRAISAVNPETPVSIQQSTGAYTVTADGTRVPQYTTIASSAQIQSLTADELRQVDGLNLQGVKRAAYINGDYAGVVRASAQGGDLFNIANGVHRGTWRVVLAIETWPDWCKVALCQQV